MSLRIASLSPDIPRAGKDCRVCNRRRIRCDRSLPTCKKCELRDLPCPGYGVRLRWPEDQASGRKRKIAKEPLANSNATATPSLDSTLDLATRSSTPSWAGPWESASSSSASSPSTPGSLVFVQQTELFGSTDSALVSTPSSIDPTVRVEEIYEEESINDAHGLDLSLSLAPLAPLPEYLRYPAERRLIHHFDRSIASCMDWIDSPENPWRNKLLPLAIESPSLMLSILALAAEHLSVKTRDNNPFWTQKQTPSSSYRDQSIKLLAQQLKAETRDESAVSRPIPLQAVNSMLGTMIVLCNLEIVKSGSPVWDLHLQAARAILQRCASAPYIMSDPTSRFLVHEYFQFDVFASTTTFSVQENAEQAHAALSDCLEKGIFDDFLLEIRRVTLLERRRHQSINLGTPFLPATMAGLQKLFDGARTRTLEFAESREFAEAVYGEFCQLVEVYHHAGLIYSYQCLIDPAFTAEEIEKSVSLLFRHAQAILPAGIFAQDQVWPVFIAGTASHGRTDRQEFVKQRLAEAMEATGFSNCEQALLFLNDFWATHENPPRTWIDYAREYTKEQPRFVVV